MLFYEFFPFFDLGETNGPSFSPPLCLELSEKFVVSGGGWWLNVNLVIGFGPGLGLGTWTYDQADQ